MVSLQIASSTTDSFNQIATAAYIHIPFCRRRCYYCDFPISVVGDRPPIAGQAGNTGGFGTIAEYVEILCQEIRSTAPLGPSLQTVFFGGGTPSLLTIPQLEQVLHALQQQFGIAANAEISMEIDPDTVDQTRLQGYQTAGVNRVSLGVQAFQSELLAACGRTHTRADVETAVELMHRVGLTNFSLDLISGLPHQTIDHWQESLEAAIALMPTHISVYDLTVEPGTAFDRWYQPGVQPLPTEETTAEMYRLAQNTLTRAGYQHYEVSNYAKPGYQCWHNRVYWENRPYYGFGMGAASYTQGQRFTRPRKRREYYEWVQNFAATGEISCPVTPPEETLLDTLMLGLRLAGGLSIKTLAQRFGEQMIERILVAVKPYVAHGWVEFSDQQGMPIASLSEITGADVQMRLSDPEGFLCSNVVLTALFKELS
jgi:putative oxygen-independent coproporphyrinogen III oxidase